MESPRWSRGITLNEGFVSPCIPTPAAKPPTGPGWVHEIKHDGYRLIVRRDDDTVRLFTRRGLTNRYPAITRAAVWMRARSFILDGEAVVCGADGIAVFDYLHHNGRATVAVLKASDLLELNGKDLRQLPIGERKAKLERLLAGSTAGIVFNEHTDEDGPAVFQRACKLGAGGIVSKRLNAPYRSGPSEDWIEVKNPDSPGNGQTPGGTMMIARTRCRTIAAICSN